MPDDKKTQLGTPPGRTHRPTGGQTPVATPAQPKTSYLPQKPDPLIGATVAGRYLVQQKLGEGGMGSVYLATHTILEKQVALKVLHGEFARKPDLVERFMQEAKAASRIRHENVIDISDFGSTPEGLVFFAMELLKGHDLHDEVTRARLAGQLLPWARTKKIFLQICAALSAAHAKGVVHRDMKPENVYLVDFLGDPDFVKLLDFGIAKVAEVEGGEGGRKLTKTGMLFGTPEYMSPEQARGEHADHRVDIYAMGCILFQLVSGRVPFEADNFMGVLSMHLTEPPPQIAPETFDHIGAPRRLAEVIDRALVKDRNQRWQSIDELANAVREVCGDPPTADRSQPNRAPSVPAPATTTRARPPTGEAPAMRRREPTGRVKTEWTGNLRVPEENAAAPPPKPRSKLPIVLGAVVVLGGGIAAAVVFTQGGSDAAPPPAPPQPQQPAVVTAPAPDAASLPAPPPPKLPETVKIELDSTPKGATVTDLTANTQLGKTPVHYSLHGATEPHRFRFHLSGYGDTTVDLVPDHDPVTYSEKLVKGATATTIKLPPPDTGSAVTHPDVGSAEKPKDTGSAEKPPEPPPEDCPELPCTKKNIPGLHGSGS